MTDAHSHILPQMDDGSRSVADSLAMLAALKSQGVDTVVATPHFYAEHDTPEHFFRKRKESFDALTAADPTLADVIRLGAEVWYYAGISRTEELSRFAIGGTELLLLEMPFSDWQRSAVKEVLDIQRERRLTVVLAHIDRYLSRANLESMEEMADAGVLMQVNAEAFTDRKKQKIVLSLLDDGLIRFLGSDCHDPQHRPPNIRPALSVIEKKLGAEAIGWLEHHSEIFSREEGLP